MDKLARPFMPISMFGSIQDYLEMASNYKEDYFTFCCDPDDKDKHNSMLFILNKLEADELINIEWGSYPRDGGKEYLQIKQLSITVKGLQLLDEIKQNSKFEIVKKRIGNMLWILVTTIFTTLIVLKLKGV